MAASSDDWAGQPLQRFLDELAGPAPTPGGGGAAALMGAMGAGLVSMVCNLTIGKKGYEEAEGLVRETLAEAETLRAELTAMIDADAQAFDGLMAAYKLPRATDEEKQARGQAIEQGLKRATDVPLDCADACGRVVALARRLAPIGNRGVISDAGVAALAAHAALRSAALAVFINAPSIKDNDFVQSRRARLDALLAQAARETEDAYAMVVKRLG